MFFTEVEYNIYSFFWSMEYGKDNILFQNSDASHPALHSGS